MVSQLLRILGGFIYKWSIYKVDISIGEAQEIVHLFGVNIIGIFVTTRSKGLGMETVQGQSC